jgi:hypothetical protein
MLGYHYPIRFYCHPAEHPTDTTGKSFRIPNGLGRIFDYIKFQIHMKPYAGGGWKNVYRLENKEEFWEKHQRLDSW